MGKTFELRAEIERLRAAGAHVVEIDLGEYTESADLRETIREKVNTGAPAAELTLAFDGFDEPLKFDIEGLGDLIKRELNRAGPERLRVLVASRTSLWRASLGDEFISWWGRDQVAHLKLAPLTKADIRAAASQLDDPDAFIEAVESGGSMPLAARPITLRLLVAAAQEDQFPVRRIDVFRRGVESLLDEPGKRRVERRRDGPPLRERFVAACHLAALTSLSGRPKVVRRARAHLPSNCLALDDLDDTGMTFEALEAVFDSALMVGDAQSRAWAHHSIEEYLCAERLAVLPMQAAVSLLTMPANPQRLVPQLTETAAWLAALDSTVFDWLLQRQPQLLVNADLRSRDLEERCKVGRAVIDQLTVGNVVTERGAYDALAYDELATDLRPLLSAEEPAWRRREAASIAAATGTRGLDDRLVEIVEHVARTSGPCDYDEELQVAGYAALALAGCDDPSQIARLCAVMSDSGAPTSLRLCLLDTLWPKHVSTAEVLMLAPSAEWFSDSSLARKVIHQFRDAVSSGSMTSAELLEWFVDIPDTAYSEAHVRELAAQAVLQTLETKAPGNSPWAHAITVVAGLLRGVCYLPADKFDTLGDDKRRIVAIDLLQGRRDEIRTHDLISCRIIRDRYLEWWLIELANGLDGQGDGGLSSRVVVDQLAWSVSHDEAVTVAQACLAKRPSLRPVIDELFSEAAIAERHRAHEMQRQRERVRIAEEEARYFNHARLADAFAAGDFPRMLGELERSAPAGTAFMGHPGPVQAWPLLTDDERSRVSHAAIAFLHSDDLDLDEWNTASSAALAHDILVTNDRPALAEIPPEAWLRWLPSLLSSPRARLACQTALRLATKHDADATERVLIAELHSEANRGSYIGLAERLHGYHSEALGRAAVDAAQEDAVAPNTLAGLLAIGAQMIPDAALAVTMAHFQRCPELFPAGQARKADDPQTAAWLKAVTATRALVSMPAFPTVFADVFSRLRDTPALATEIIRGWQGGRHAADWQRLKADQLAELYLWASTTFPTRQVQPGVVVSRNLVEEFPGFLLGLLTQRGDREAAEALSKMASKTGDAWLLHAAQTAHDSALAAERQPPSPAALAQLLADPHLQPVTTTAQLAAVILEKLDQIDGELAKDRARRAELWQRQRRNNKWDDTYVPVSEKYFSTWLARQLKARIGHRIVLTLEAEIQPRLGADPADQPDILCTITEEAQISVPIEVKCNWNSGVVTALKDQLAHRYLAGPAGSEGIYIVGCFYGTAWPDQDKKQRTTARRRDPKQLTDELHTAANSVASQGVTVHVRALGIPLDSNPCEDQD
ncbi:MAG: NACHT domain-containing protein [Pseudonocardiaceae bacterium]